MNSERQALIDESGVELPTPEETTAYLRRFKAPSVADALERADREGRLLFQPRCGVGSHDGMISLLQELEREARPEILSVTIDSYTRLKKFDRAGSVLRADPSRLNGYPLVNHGFMRGRELQASVAVPLEIRHGSPDARLLFETALASGITSFEGGGIGYNLPYCKDVPILDSLRSWNYVDRVCGSLVQKGVIVDRELFGTLSAVLMPPSIALAMTMLEAILAARAGVRCLSIAYPQGGNAIQDVAALKSIRALAAEYLPADVKVYPVLHEFMGAFPSDSIEASSLILYGALIARLGGATKIITKSRQEALGIPTAVANAEGIRTARMAVNAMFDFVGIDHGRVEEEAHWIQRETREILEPVLGESELIEGIARGFEQGALDIPFATSRHARSSVIPVRDREGAIRFLSAGGLAFSDASLRRNSRLAARGAKESELATRVLRDITFFSSGHYASKKEFGHVS